MSHALKLTLVLSTLLLGCGPAKQKEETKLPRPVSVYRLATSDPGDLSRQTGSVASWKTEEIGFEVSGRVKYVIEPETDVDGQLFSISKDAQGTTQRKAIREGQVLAVLDDRRYRLAVESVKAQIATAKQQKIAAGIEVKEVIPRERDAAQANLNFYVTEIKRQKPLVRTQAVSQAEFDKTKANHDAALANLKQVEARKEVKIAEVASLQAKVNELEETKLQAERDVEDCLLRAPFRGQVAKVHVIPGGVVKAGQPIVALQMMDPIKVDFEVSAQTSRQLSYRDSVDVWVPKGLSQRKMAATETDTTTRKQAFIYTIDPVADPKTRTFTVTLLMRNKKLQLEPPPEWKGPVVRARDVWELAKADFLKDSDFFVEAHAIQGPAGQEHVWKIMNWEDVRMKRTDIMNIKRIKVTPGDLHIDWLGIWSFRELTVPGGEVTPTNDFVVGEIIEGTAQDNGNVLLDRQQWRMRPGDLVEVALQPGQNDVGFYVPMDAVLSVAGKQYIFSVSDGQVQRREVEIAAGPNTLKRISAAAGSPPLTDGMKIVAAGGHFLTDGEAVNVVEELKVAQ